MHDLMEELDPEVAEIFAEVAADPRSCLNQRPKGSVAAWTERRDDAITGREPFMSRAERHLVRAYREEVAEFFYKACQARVLKGPLSAHLGTRLSRRCIVQPPTVAEITLRTGRLLAEETYKPELMESKRWSTNQLALASLRLVPRDATRIWMGLTLLERGHHHPGLRVFADTARLRPTQLHRDLCHLNSGLAWLMLGRTRNSWEAYRLAGLSNEEFPAGQVYWMMTSLLIGNKADFILAAHQLQHSDPSVDSVLAECRRIIRPENWLVGFSGRSRRLLQVTTDRLPATARSLLSVIS